MKPLLKVGYVARAHGLGGEVVIKTFDPSSVALSEVERLVAQAPNGDCREFQILAVGEAPGGDLRLRLEGVKGRDAADALKGSTVLVYRDDLSAPDGGEFFFGDLEGLRAIAPDGRGLGIIEGVWSTGPVPNLVIRSDTGEELLVPFAEDFVSNIDVQGGTIQVTPLTFED